MRGVFADTSFYQALFNRRDKWHDAAVGLLAGIDTRIVTTDYVLVELGALMSRGAARSLFIGFVERAQSDTSTDIVSASAELLDGGLALFATRPDKEWSLTDCISFVVMERQGITDALTCDYHFEQAGFQVALRR